MNVILTLYAHSCQPVKAVSYILGYVGHPGRALRYATKVDSVWQTEAAGPSYYFCGSASLALDDDNRPHIACHDHEEGGLYYTVRRLVD